MNDLTLHTSILFAWRCLQRGGRRWVIRKSVGSVAAGAAFYMWGRAFQVTPGIWLPFEEMVQVEHDQTPTLRQTMTAVTYYLYCERLRRGLRH